MRYKSWTYIAINVNIQNINIFFIWYLYYAINSHSHKSEQEKKSVDIFTFLAYWLSFSFFIHPLCLFHIFYAICFYAIGPMPILNDALIRITNAVMIEPIFMRSVSCAQNLFALCYAILYLLYFHFRSANILFSLCTSWKLCVAGK